MSSLSKCETRHSDPIRFTRACLPTPMLALISAPTAWYRLRLPTAAASRPHRLRTASISSSEPSSPRLWSPSDLTLFSESPWASWLERLAREQPTHPLASAMDAPDAFLQMLGRKGAESEEAVLRSLRANCGDHNVIDLSAVRGSAKERVSATRAALAAGPAIIYQAPLMGGGFYGIADFLVRVDDQHALQQQAPATAASAAAAASSTSGDLLLACEGSADRLAAILSKDALKSECAARKLRVSGTKAVLAPRLVEALRGEEAAAAMTAAAATAAARYMVWDAKLGRQPRPSQALQLCCYAEMLAEQQRAPVESVGLILGATPLVLRVSSYDALYRRVRARTRVCLAWRACWHRAGLVPGGTATLTAVRSAPALAQVRRRFLAAQDAFDAADDAPPLPDPRMPAGRWSGLAASQLDQRDDLRRVARLSRLQAVRLRAAGVGTATELAALDPASRHGGADSGTGGEEGGGGQGSDEGGGGQGGGLPVVAGVPPAALRRLARQAALQQQAALRPDAPPPFELLRGACASASGLGLLPLPDPADAFFDLEGFPFATLPALAAADAFPDLHWLSSVAADEAAASADASATAVTSAPSEGGREYLWGISTRPGAEAADAASGEYLAWWAHDAAAERAAFIAAVDWIVERKRASPEMHVYHYGAYEVSALRRLAGRYGAREDAVDEILRRGVLVDLYDVVRHGLLLGEPRYSIKNVERLYRPKRDTDVGKGDQSVAVYNAWLEAPDGADEASSPTLRSLAEYNRDDCVSTRQLAEWLWRLRCVRCGAPRARAANRAVVSADGEADDDEDAAHDVPSAAVAEEEAEVARLEGVLLGDEHGAAWAEGDWPPRGALSDAGVRETLAGMLRYHRREAKPQWWRRYEWLASPPSELLADARTLGGLVRTAREPFKSAPRKRRLAYEFRFEASQVRGDCSRLLEAARNRLLTGLANEFRFEPSQEVNLAEGSGVVLRDDEAFVGAADGGGAGSGLGGGSGGASSSDTPDGAGDGEGKSLGGTLLTLDRAAGLAVIECGQVPPARLSLLPNEFVDGAPVARALRATAASMVAAPGSRTALGELLARNVPTVAVEAADGQLEEATMAPFVSAAAAEGEAAVLSAAVSTVVSLRRSYLCVQVEN